MKKIIISRSHLRKINEENSVNINAQAIDNSLTAFSKAATDTNTQSDIQKAKSFGDVNLMVTGPKADDSQPTQVVNVGAGDTVQNALADQGSDELIRNGGAIKITGDGIGESRIFTKRELKEARLAKIKKEGKIFSKKELMEEMFK